MQKHLFCQLKIMSYLCSMKGTIKTSKLTYKEIRTIVSHTVKWCEQNLGTNNRRKNKFKISVKKQTKSEVKNHDLLMGSFCAYTNSLTVYYDNNPTVKDLIKTTIHEYTHFLQPIRSYYHKIAKLIPYNKHPMELEAVLNETIHYKECKKHISSKL